MSAFAVRTDLALEEGERIRESGVEIHGVILEEETRRRMRWDRGWRTDCLLTGTSFSSLALQRITGKK